MGLRAKGSATGARRLEGEDASRTKACLKSGGKPRRDGSVRRVPDEIRDFGLKRERHASQASRNGRADQSGGQDVGEGACAAVIDADDDPAGFVQPLERESEFAA